MPTIDTPEVFVAQVICLVLFPCVLFAPARWAVLCWLVMGNLDATGPSPLSTNIGWINAAKGIVLPLCLWWRLRNGRSETWSALPTRLWIVLTLYAALAGLWSPFPLAAAKLVGNMIGIVLTILVVEKAARRGVVDHHTMTWLILGSLGLGVVQTFYFGGVTFGADGPDQPTRFSSFVWAQQYAAFLVAFLTVVLWGPGFRRPTRLALFVLLSAALVMNGSRTWFIGAALVISVYLCSSLRRMFIVSVFGLSTAALGTLLALNLISSGEDPVADTSSRIIATLEALATGQDTARKVGLANLDFRVTIYRDVVEEVRASNARELLFGHGTSSGGNVVLRLFPWIFKADRLDANRAVHNEWLRALYEWGLVGLTLLIAIFATLSGGLVARSRGRSRIRSAAILSFLPAFLLAFTTENVIAGAGNAVTMGLALTAALLWTPDAEPTEASPLSSNKPWHKAELAAL
jgi:hypothetical protein